jgi:hypothetical protein
MATILVAFLAAQVVFGVFIAVEIRAERAQRRASAPAASNRLHQGHRGAVVRSWARRCRERLGSTLALARLVPDEHCDPYALPMPYADLRILRERRGSRGTSPATLAWRKAA